MVASKLVQQIAQLFGNLGRWISCQGFRDEPFRSPWLVAVQSQGGGAAMQNRVGGLDPIVWFKGADRGAFKIQCLSEKGDGLILLASVLCQKGQIRDVHGIIVQVAGFRHVLCALAGGLLMQGGGRCEESRGGERATVLVGFGAPGQRGEEFTFDSCGELGMLGFVPQPNLRLVPGGGWLCAATAIRKARCLCPAPSA